MSKKLIMGINVFDGKSDWTIHEGSPEGPTYTLEQARHEWEEGNISKCTPAFKRLIELNWDMHELKYEFVMSFLRKRNSPQEVIDLARDLVEDILREAKRSIVERN